MEQARKQSVSVIPLSVPARAPALTSLPSGLWSGCENQMNTFLPKSLFLPWCLSQQERITLGHFVNRLTNEISGEYGNSI